MSTEDQEPESGLRLGCRLEGESLCLTLHQMANLFGRDKSVIHRHVKSISGDAELLRGQLLQNMQPFKHSDLRGISLSNIIMMGGIR